MPKGRHLKPEFFTDKHIVSMAPLARLLYEGLWCYAADCGHLDDEPLELKMRILPADNCDVDILLDEIADQGRIERKDGVIYLPKLSDHSRVDKRYETKCEACKARSEHAEKTKPEPPQHEEPTRDHDVTTTGSQRDHDADGDGDGDGDGDVSRPRGGRRAKRATQIPNSWEPTPEHRVLAADLGVDIEREAAKFRDWCAAKGATYKDWRAAFRNWLRNARPSLAPPPQLRNVRDIPEPPPNMTDDQIRDWYDQQRRQA